MSCAHRLAGPLAALALLGACAEDGAEGGAAGSDSRAAAPLEVYVVSYPLRYLAERIGGEAVRVRLPVPSGVDPADWVPAPEVVAAYQRADLILDNGAGYARWVGLVSLPRSRVVDTSAAFRERWLPREQEATHAHGPAGSHAGGGHQSHTWLDPTLAALQARAVADALARARPGARPRFEAGLAALERDLAELDDRLAAASAPLRDVPLLFSHPVYGYLIRRYGLHARSLHLEPGEPPDPAAWRALRALLAGHPAGWLLWEAEPLEATRRALRELGVESVVVATGGVQPPEGDLLSILGANAATLARLGEDHALTRSRGRR